MTECEIVPRVPGGGAGVVPGATVVIEEGEAVAAYGLEDDVLATMIALRREIHAEPELSNHEYDTRERVRRALTENGVGEPVEVVDTGLMVDIEGAMPGPSIAIRADLDALPIEERSGLDFASRRPGVMHACGHDTHTAMVTAAAITLSRRRETLRGTARIIFQPAEEFEPLGGRRIVEQGYVEKVDGVIGVHVDPSIDRGHIGVRAGPFACSADDVDVTLHAKAAHGARPHEGVDGLLMAASFLTEVQRIRSRESDPLHPVVVTFGTIEGGDARNILADRVSLSGTVRSMSESARELAHRRVEAIAQGIAALHGGRAEVSIHQGEPVLLNAASMVSLIEQAGDEVGGTGTVIDIDPWAAADDFAFYARTRPSVYFRLGVRNEAEGCVHGLHHPSFRVDEQALPLGAAVIVRAAERFLAG